ncbi:MAG: hypothetical protein HY234_12205 [Acidobacteria bacterium]|nr:hypothetical protein [Acidobacteriota bacterium]
MKSERRLKKMYPAIAAILAALLFAQSAPAQEKRFLVRYDHGSANLAPWAGLKLYVGAERVRIFAGNEVIHDIPVANITSVTHELRAPFDPAKTTERVFNDTVGACSNLVDCAVLGSAGVVGAAGVGVATLFTPKELVITINWLESSQPRELAMKIAWYQKDFILRALKKSTGRSATERLPGASAPVKIPAAMPPAAQTSRAASPSSTPAPAESAVPAPQMQATSAQVAALAEQEPPRTGSPGMIRRFELILDRSARVGDALLPPGFYLVLVQERMNGKAMVVFLDDSAQNSPTTKVLAKAFADLVSAPDATSIQSVFAGEGAAARLSEIRLPGRTLQLNN